MSKTPIARIKNPGMDIFLIGAPVLLNMKNDVIFMGFIPARSLPRATLPILNRFKNFYYNKNGYQTVTNLSR